MNADNALWMQQTALSLIFAQTRRHTLDLVHGLTAEDCLLQSMPEASPAKWHLAHTTWFFETFVLARLLPDFRPFNADWLPLFNSYYLSLGEPHARPRRGLLSRPALHEVLAWREKVDTQMLELLATPLAAEWLDLVLLGINHEEQHQELILTDLKHHFWCNPLQPAYRSAPEGEAAGNAVPVPLHYRDCEGGLVEVGHDGNGFGFDNERPRHRVWLDPFALASRLVSNGEYLAFMRDGGYGRPELWLSDGWECCQREHWQAPLYWFRQDGRWWHFTLNGPQPLRMDAPVAHVSFYEADAYARWAGARLPREEEWEQACALWQEEPPAISGDGADYPPPQALQPQPAPAGASQLYGTLWQWTASAYLPYPGFRAPPGPVGEYNGKFMSGQMVLRGSSCVTPPRHARCSYRNFFAPQSRWQFTGIRLARDGKEE